MIPLNLFVIAPFQRQVLSLMFSKSPTPPPLSPPFPPLEKVPPLNQPPPQYLSGRRWFRP